ncbi:MAG: hypothetical protein HOP33_12870 [Verrucomicrobia bacterium]|nr:hypothetical protein [Verrucomicrobiota bacterium]
MKPTESQIKERLPIWKALSEFFLDTELQQENLERIARILAASDHSEDELENILICEVCRGCRINALLPAGEWVSFDEDWLVERIGPYYGRQVWFKRLFIWRHRWIYDDKWKKVRPRIAEIRAQKIHLC